ncbi:MAG: dipeptide ABC transporter ATP-binding protein [Kiritimatiellae bacterium]|nr:dipeptide ABC transporter ATP-binding protein [Kiritimatiellia bacterium]
MTEVLRSADEREQMDAAAPVLEVEDLGIEFASERGRVPVVDGVSFGVGRGKVLALVGESGCGKSLTALSLLGLLPPGARISTGAIRFEGQDLARAAPRELRAIRGNRIAMVFQEPMTALNPVLTIGAQVAEALRLHRGLPRSAAWRRAAELLAGVGLPDAERRCVEYPHQLSGGQRQRVMIAMAIACDPVLLIADEPTTALDVTVQAQVFELLREVTVRRGRALLLITHDLGVVYENADRVAVMYAGRIVEEAEREALFSRPAHPYTQMLLRAVPARAAPGERLAVIPGQVPPVARWAEGCRFADRCPLAIAECRARRPPWRVLNDAHRVACIRAPCRVGEARNGAGVRRSASTAAERLRIERLCVHFPLRRRIGGRRLVVRAVDGVDLIVRAGETLALVGESGCGKTTVGRAVVGLAPVTAGEIRLDGERMLGQPFHVLKPLRRRVQMVFQDPASSLDPRMPVGQAILEGMEIHRIGRDDAERRERVAALLERVGLPAAAASRYPHQFSGGQRQRIGLARALAVEPEVIICDEATSSLDVSVQAQMLNLLRDLQAERGLSYLFITHDLAVVRHLADRVAVMYLGEIVETGPATEVLEAPLHPYTVALVAAVPRIGADGRRRIVLAGDVPSPIAPPPGCRFHPRCPHAMAHCRLKPPPWFGASGDRRARCWLLEASTSRPPDEPPAGNVTVQAAQ